ncbi:MAG: DUF2959 family protein [Chitinophagales bacterium]
MQTTFRNVKQRKTGLINYGLLLLAIGIFTISCNRSPEKLPKFKTAFKSQIASFESQKEKTDKKVEEGVVGISTLQAALDSAKNVDKEFNKVYAKWKRIDKQVDDLNKEYEELKGDAENLFSAMERQTESLTNTDTRNELTNALRKTKNEYYATLAETQGAIDNLHALHTDAIDIVKALEVAVALGQVAQINEGLRSIEDRVASIMDQLNESISESKDLYDKKIGGV